MSKKTKGRVTRSETVSVRLDPRLRYLATIAARKQRRTLSSYIESVVEESLDRVWLSEKSSVASQSNHLWDIAESERVCRLGAKYPELLTYEEQLIWSQVQRNGYFWADAHFTSAASDDAGKREVKWEALPTNLIRYRVEEQWATLQAIAAGDADRSALPQPTPREPGPDEAQTDDDIPF